MSDITVLGIFVADISFSGNKIPTIGETILGDSYNIGPGGKGCNQAIAISRLGGQVNFISKLGNDEYGKLAISKLKKDNIAFYDVIYGHIGVQNGYHTWNNKSDDPVKPGDGYKYRGRGFNQLTFKQSYKKYAKETGVDILNNPDLLNSPNTAAEVCVKFLLNRLKSKSIDPNSFNSTQEAINKFAAANAGWNKNPDRAIASATEVASNFSV